MIYNLPRKKAKFEETWVIKQFPELMYGSITMEIHDL
nr:MAG TPA: nucleophosmin protein [Caudoviricetes sp.]